MKRSIGCWGASVLRVVPSCMRRQKTGTTLTGAAGTLLLRPLTAAVLLLQPPASPLHV